MDDSSKAIKALLNSVETIVKHYVGNASFDKTKSGRVIAVLENGKYKVDVQGTEFTVPSSTNMTFSSGDTVWVLFPCNNTNNAHITGKRQR